MLVITRGFHMVSPANTWDLSRSHIGKKTSGETGDQLHGQRNGAFPEVVDMMTLESSEPEN